MTDFTKFCDDHVSHQRNISEELMTLLTAATLHKSVLDGFRALGIATCGGSTFRRNVRNVDKKHGPLHRLEASKLVEV